MGLHQVTRDRSSHGRLRRRSHRQASVRPPPLPLSKFRRSRADVINSYFAFDSPAHAEDLNLQDTKAYGGPNHITAGIQHGSWSIHTKPGKPPKDSFVSSSQTTNVREDLDYSKEDIAAVEEWVKRHVETTWHSTFPSPLPIAFPAIQHR